MLNTPPPQGVTLTRWLILPLKKIFGSEPNKDLLIDFLNQVFRNRKVIADLVYKKTEHPGNTLTEGSATFDLLCTGPDGEHFIIEVQRAGQKYFKDRTVFYTSRLISDQAPKGGRANWGYQLPEVYFIALLDNFALQDGKAKKYLHDICLCDRENGSVFYDKLNFTFIELNKFVKKEAKLQTDLDKWLYVLKHLSRMDKLPVYLRKPLFEKLFSIAEYTKLSKEEKMYYDSSLKQKWDNENVMQYAIEQAVEQAVEHTKETTLEETAKKMKEKGYPVKDISDITGLSVEEIKKL